MQRDFILREIEKIGTIINAVRQKIFGGKDNLSLTLENTKETLLREANFDLDIFLNLNTEKSNEYICSFDGFSIENIELFAECLSNIGFDGKCENSKKYLEKALQLYDLCNLKSKTYSFERETNINTLKNALKQHSTENE